MSAQPLRTALNRLLSAVERADRLHFRRHGTYAVGERCRQQARAALDAPEPSPALAATGKDKAIYDGIAANYWAADRPPIAAAVATPTPSVEIKVGGTPLWLTDTPAGAAERDRLEWAFIARTLADCRKHIEADGSRQSWLDPAEAIARERAR